MNSNLDGVNKIQICYYNIDQRIYVNMWHNHIYTATLTHIQQCNIVHYYVGSLSQLLTFLCYAKLCDGAANVDTLYVAGEFCHHEVL